MESTRGDELVVSDFDKNFQARYWTHFRLFQDTIKEVALSHMARFPSSKVQAEIDLMFTTHCPSSPPFSHTALAKRVKDLQAFGATFHPRLLDPNKSKFLSAVHQFEMYLSLPLMRESTTGQALQPFDALEADRLKEHLNLAHSNIADLEKKLRWETEQRRESDKALRALQNLKLENKDLYNRLTIAEELNASHAKENGRLAKKLDFADERYNLVQKKYAAMAERATKAEREANALREALQLQQKHRASNEEQGVTAEGKRRVLADPYVDGMIDDIKSSMKARNEFIRRLRKVLKGQPDPARENTEAENVDGDTHEGQTLHDETKHERDGTHENEVKDTADGKQDDDATSERHGKGQNSSKHEPDTKEERGEENDHEGNHEYDIQNASEKGKGRDLTGIDSNTSYESTNSHMPNSEVALVDAPDGTQPV